MWHKILIVVFISSVIYLFNGCGGGGGNNTTTHNNPPTTPPVTTTNSMKFTVSVANTTPNDDFICINFDDNQPALKMSKTDIVNQWTIDINQSDFLPTNRYKYCRDCECEAADELLNTTSNYREFDFQAETTQNDTVSAWRWLDPNNINFELNTTGYITQKPDINKTTFFTGMLLNDWWKHQWIDSFDTTMKHIKNDTASKWIQITPISQINNINDPANLTITQVGANGISDEDLNRSIQLAHNNGLKVFLNPSLWSFQEDQHYADHNQTWWDNFERAWRPILLHYAKLAQDNNVEMLEFKMWYDIDSINTNEANKTNPLANQLLTDIAAQYNGEIATQSVCYDHSKPILDIFNSDKIDYLAINIWPYYPWHLGNSKDDNVSQIYNNLDSNLTYCHQFYTDNNITKPIIIEQLSSASYDGAIIQAITDDEAIDSFHENNISVVLDLQEQADMIEASLHSISQQNWIVGNFVFTYFFWDSIGKDINVRGKPAQKVIKKWYDWLNNL